ncbi:hypothetical protein ABXJ76_06965 [Methylobacter sp. G7]|uniref:hypothetical protein n=1 Tax=Methylobacter sp. G7 TaxID=3230117 RepID=UPI003D806563
MVTIKNQTALEHGKKLLSDAHGYEFLSDTWPERLGIDDIAVLQSGDIEGPDYLAWDVCLTKAGEVGELATQPQQWGVATDSPPEFWTGVAPTRHFIIPLCHEHLIDGAILWPVGLQLKYTISPLDFAEYLKKQHVQPSKFIAAWFDAFEIETPTTEPQAEAVANDGAGSHAETETKKPLTKLEKQQEAILDAMKIKQFKPMQIPDGEKGTIRLICESDYSELFKAETAFDRAWKAGINELWRMEHHESYARRGKEIINH